MNAPVRPLEGAAFRLFVAGRAVSTVGDVVTRIGIPILVLDQNGSGAMLGVIGALQTAPALFFGLIAGALADRFDKRATMIAADIGSALFTALIPLAHLLHLDVLMVTAVVALPIGLLRVLYLAAYSAAIPEIVGREDLPRAMSLLRMVEAGANVVGPALVGFLVVRLGAATTMTFDAISFAVSAAALTALPRLPAVLSSASKSLKRDVAEGLRFVARHRLLRSIILLWSAVTVATAGMLPVMMFWATQDLKVDMRWVGLAMSIFAAGSIAGAIVISRVAKEHLGSGMLIGILVYGTVLIGVSSAAGAGSQMVLFALLAVTGGAAFGAMNVAYYTLLPLASPRALVGRVGSTAKTVAQASQSLGMMATGAALEVLRGTGSLRVMGATMIFAGVVSLFSANLRHVGGQLIIEDR